MLYIVYYTIYIYIVCAPQYPTRGGIETMPEYLEACSDKLILNNSMCDVANIILKSNYFEKT